MVSALPDIDHLDALMASTEYFLKLKLGHVSKLIPILNYCGKKIEFPIGHKTQTWKKSNYLSYGNLYTVVS